MDKQNLYLRFQIFYFLSIAMLTLGIGIPIKVVAAHFSVYFNRGSVLDLLPGVVAIPSIFLTRSLWRKLGWSLEAESVAEIADMEVNSTVTESHFHLNTLPSRFLAVAAISTGMMLLGLFFDWTTRNWPRFYGDMIPTIIVCALISVICAVLWWRSRTRFAPNFAVSLDESGAKGRFRSDVKRIAWQQVQRAQVVTRTNELGAPSQQIIVLRDGNNLPLLELVLNSFEPKDRQRAITFVQKQLARQHTT